MVGHVVEQTGDPAEYSPYLGSSTLMIAIGGIFDPIGSTQSDCLFLSAKNN